MVSKKHSGFKTNISILFFMIQLLIGCRRHSEPSQSSANNAINQISDDSFSNNTIYMVNQKSSCNIYFDKGVKGVCELFVPIDTVSIIKNFSLYFNTWDTASSDIYCKNLLQDEYLKMVQIPGSGKNSFGYFEIGYLKEIKPISFNILSLKIKKLVSLEGIGLGMSFEKILTVIGTKHSVQEIMPNGNIKVTYSLTEDDCSTLLERYNMPSYEAILEFNSHKKLSKFSFGFLNP